jgi:hypothetical protein
VEAERAVPSGHDQRELRAAPRRLHAPRQLPLAHELND